MRVKDVFDIVMKNLILPTTINKAEIMFNETNIPGWNDIAICAIELLLRGRKIHFCTIF